MGFSHVTNNAIVIINPRSCVVAFVGFCSLCIRSRTAFATCARLAMNSLKHASCSASKSLASKTGMCCYFLTTSWCVAAFSLGVKVETCLQTVAPVPCGQLAVLLFGPDGWQSLQAALSLSQFTMLVVRLACYNDGVCPFGASVVACFSSLVLGQ